MMLNPIGEEERLAVQSVDADPVEGRLCVVQPGDRQLRDPVVHPAQSIQGLT